MSSVKTGSRQKKEKGKRLIEEVKIIYATKSDAALNDAYRLLAQYFLKEMGNRCERPSTSG